MAGPGKGKKKKNREKSSKVDKSEKKKQGNSDSFEENVGELEQFLHQKVELLYKKALEKLLRLGYKCDVATRSLLMNGSIFGCANILANIFLNAMDFINKGHVYDPNPNIEPIFDNLHDLAISSTQTLINLLIADQPEMSKKDAMLYILQNNYLSDNLCAEDQPQNDKLGQMLNKSIASMQGLHINNSIESSSTSKQEGKKPQSTSSNVRTSSNESLPDALEVDSWELIESFSDCVEGRRLEDWLKSIPEVAFDEFKSKLSEHIQKLSEEVNERREWAKRIVLQAAKRLGDTKKEISELILETNERDRLLARKEGLERALEQINEKETMLKNLNDEIRKAYRFKQVLEDKSKEMKAEISSHDLNISESKKCLVKTRRREEKEAKQCKDAEKHIGDLKGIFIVEQEQKLAEMEQKIQQVIEEKNQAELRLRQEKKEKEDACFLLAEHNRLNRLEKENSRRRLACVRYELDMKYKQMMDEQNRLEIELAKLKSARESPSGESSSSSSYVAPASTTPAELANLEPHGRNSRLCTICKNNDVCIMFLPCAHEVICSECNDDVFFTLEDCCPYCNTHIDSQVRVFGPN